MLADRAESREFLRTPPSAVDAEQSVLGALMLANDALPNVADWLAPEDFYRRDHGLIYRAICEQAEARKPFDAVTLGDWFEAQGLSDEVDGGAYLIQLASAAFSAANVVAYAEIVRDKSVLRQLIEVGTGIVNDGYQPSGKGTAEIVADASRALVELKGNPRAGGLLPASAGLNDWFQDLERRYEGGNSMTGLPYPWDEVNKVTHGLQAGELTIIAGRPSMGKSIAGLNLALMNALRGVNVAYVSLEMTTRQVNRRCIASLASVPHDWLLAPNRERESFWPLVSDAVRQMKSAALLVDDSSGLTAVQIAARLRRAHMRKPVQMIVLDHMHDVRLPGKRDARFEVGDIAALGKDLAKEFGCPAVWLAQLNRGLENRADKRPTMADLRESGEIEQKADVIWFLYREDYYQRNTPGWQRQHAVELILGKGRDLNVEDANVILRAEFDCMRMADWDVHKYGPTPQRVASKAGKSDGFK